MRRRNKTHGKQLFRLHQRLTKRTMARENTKLIGILAGMGPKSTAPFLDQVVAHCQLQYGARNDLDFPPMMVLSWPTPFFADRPVDHEALRDSITRGLKKLESTGVAFIAMPCNTAHIYYDTLQRQVTVPLLNMVSLAVGALPASARNVALLATRATSAAGVYQNTLSRAGFEVLHDEMLQTKVDALISAVKSTTTSDVAQSMVSNVITEVQQRGAEAVLAACTDLAPILVANNPALQIVDAGACLAQAVVREWRLLARDET